jgi:hypothetical protein
MPSIAEVSMLFLERVYLNLEIRYVFMARLLRYQGALGTKRPEALKPLVDASKRLVTQSVPEAT